MPLAINVGLSRKASKNYQSTGVSINVTAELDQALLAKPEDLQQQIGNLYRQAENALDQQAQIMSEPEATHRYADRRDGQAARSNGGTGWQIQENGNTVKAAGAAMPTGGLRDPLPHASSAIERRLSVPYPWNLKHPDLWIPKAFKIEPDFTDTNGCYYNENVVTDPAQMNSNVLVFKDSPSQDDGSFAPDEFLEFRTKAVLEDANANVICDIGNPFVWWSNQVTDGGAIYFSVDPDEAGLLPIVGGEITVPEPASLSLLALGLIFAHRRRR